MYVDPTLTPLIKINTDKNSEKYYARITLHRNPISEASDMYELKMALSSNGKLEDFILLQCNYQILPEASGNITSGEKIQYLLTLIRGEALREL